MPTLDGRCELFKLGSRQLLNPLICAGSLAQPRAPDLYSASILNTVIELS